MLSAARGLLTIAMPASSHSSSGCSADGSLAHRENQLGVRRARPERGERVLGRNQRHPRAAVAQIGGDRSSSSASFDWCRPASIRLAVDAQDPGHARTFQERFGRGDVLRPIDVNAVRHRMAATR